VIEGTVVSDADACRVVVVVHGTGPLALDGAQGEIVPAHDFADARAEEEGGA
jgi:hypothetical protein